MILKLMISGLVLFGAFFAVNRESTPVSCPQDDKKQPSQDDMAKLMAMYEKAAMPGDQHRGLAALVGKWTQNNKFMMGGPPTESAGTCEYRTIHGGRFVIGENSCKMAIPGPDGKPVEKPFSGFNLLGYDNTLKQYQSCWCDSMGTGIFWTTGTADASGKTITFEGTMKDALTPAGRPWKMVMTIENNDKHVIELWDAMDGKTLAKVGVITETRAK